MTMISAKEVDAGRPKYLIIFKEPSEKNTSTLSTVLRRGTASDSFGPEGVSVLAAARSGVETKVYETLGVAAADLTDTQVANLEKREDVQAVVENEVRYLPPVRRSLRTTDDSTFDRSRSDTLAYWQGIRDAADFAIAGSEGRPQSEIRRLRRATTNVSSSATTWGLQAIIADSILPKFSGKGIKVAVLDTGIDLHHPDLHNKVVEGVSAQSFVQGVSVQDAHGHGTHCAGIICGPRNSVGGVRYGVAPDVNLLVGKVFNNAMLPWATDDDIIEGITWAEQNGARIISMSLGSSRSTEGAFPLLYETIARQLLTRDENSVLLVAAAGNASDRPNSVVCVENPAACPSIFAVAAINKQKRIAWFSCGQLDAIGAVDVSAPGVGIYSSVTGGTFEEFDGTSMATPHVAGLAALYLERRPNLTATQLIQELKNYAEALGDPADFGAGLVRIM